jgi:hypothetical protein
LKTTGSILAALGALMLVACSTARKPVAAPSVPTPPRAEPILEPAILGLRDLQYSAEAGEEYGGPDLRDGEVYGVIVEIGVEGTIVLVAGFKDGTSRLIMGKGGGVLGNKNNFPFESRVLARRLVEVAAPLVAAIPRETARPLPPQGHARFALLTRDGSHGALRSIASLERGEGDLAALWGPANHLLNVLLQFQQQRQPPSPR